MPGTEEKLLVARAVSNWHRRPVGREEKAEWINGLAKIYKKQGLKITGKSVTLPNGVTTSNEIVVKIMEVTGLAYVTVHNYLGDSWKQEAKAKGEPRVSQVSAYDRIRNTLGEEAVERLRKQVLEEERARIFFDHRNCGSPEYKSSLFILFSQVLWRFLQQTARTHTYACLSHGLSTHVLVSRLTSLMARL